MHSLGGDKSAIFICMWHCEFAFVCTFIASLSCWASYWAGVFNRANTTSSRSPFRAFFSADSRGYNEFKQALRKCWPWVFPVGLFFLLLFFLLYITFPLECWKAFLICCLWSLLLFTRISIMVFSSTPKKTSWK